MAESPARLFDRQLLARRRTRHAARLDDHDFLLRRIADDVVLRLRAVQRAFPLVVDLGAHHGLLTGMIGQLEQVGCVIGTESCEAMLCEECRPGVVCEEDLLPFAAGSVDLMVSGLSLHLVNDLPGALIQIRRALRPDGLFLAAILGGRTLQELRESMAVAEDEIDGGISPRVAPFADVRDYGALLQRAGFALPVTDTDVVTATYANPLALMNDVRAMGASNMLYERRRVPLKRRTLMRAAEVYAERFSTGTGRVSATFEIIHLTGWAPDPSQPKSLAPGSARARLADALGVEEISAGEKAGPGDSEDA